MSNNTFRLSPGLWKLTCYILILNTFCKSQWITPSTPTLFRADYAMAIGSYGQSIYILGSLNYDHVFQLTEYNISGNVFIDHGLNKFPKEVYGEGQYFTQMDNVLYMIHYEGVILTSYDLQTDVFNDNYQTIPSNIGEYGCLTSTDDHLYVIGGYFRNKNLDIVQLLDLTNNIWLSGIPSLQQARCSPACAVVPSTNVLYVIGGYTYTQTENHIDTIEKVSTNNIAQNSWSFINPLPRPAKSKCILHGNNVYIIGGVGRDSNSQFEALDTVIILDGMLETLSILPQRLPYKVWDFSVLIVDNILYIFGGYDGTQAFDTWVYYELPDPTMSPTDNPSAPSPTDNPSDIPSVTPTDDPSQLPSDNPSASPIFAPMQTQYPTTAPSGQPTLTFDPTNAQTSNPSLNTTPAIMTTGPTTNQKTTSTKTSLNPTNIQISNPAETSKTNRKLRDEQSNLVVIMSITTTIVVICVVTICYLQRKRKSALHNLEMTNNDADAQKARNVPLSETKLVTIAAARTIGRIIEKHMHDTEEIDNGHVEGLGQSEGVQNAVQLAYTLEGRNDGCKTSNATKEECVDSTHQSLGDV
eukprot:187061_1